MFDEIDYPWTVRNTSPHREYARAHNVRWLRSHGLFDRLGCSEEVYRGWGLGEAAANVYPDATRDGLTLAADVISWYFAFDDPFDGDLGRDPKGSAELVGRLLAVLDSTADDVETSSDDPVVLAFADIWRRSRTGMSTDWQTRSALHWRNYLVANLLEVVDRAYGRSLDAEFYLHQRAATISTYTLNDLIERVTGHHLSTVAWHSPVLTEMRLLTAELVSINNDFASYRKEKASGLTGNNLLLLLETAQEWDHEDASAHLRRLAEHRIQRLLELETHLIELDVLLDGQQRDTVRRYVTGLHDLLAADWEYERNSGRYATTA